MEVIYQQYLFFAMLFFGMTSGVAFEAFALIKQTLFKARFLKFVLDFCWCVLSMFIFFFALNYCCFGEFRLYLTLSFLLGIYLERKILGHYVAKAFICLYNFFSGLIKKILKRMQKNKGVKKHDTNKN